MIQPDNPQKVASIRDTLDKLARAITSLEAALGTVRTVRPAVSPRAREDAKAIAAMLMANPATHGELFAASCAGLGKRRFEAAWPLVRSDPKRYGLGAYMVMAMPARVVYGQPDAARAKAAEIADRLRKKIVDVTNRNTRKGKQK